MDLSVQIICESLTARLACIRHAASVHPEPGSNSPKKNLEMTANKLALSEKNSNVFTKFVFTIIKEKIDVDLHYSVFNVLSRTLLLNVRKLRDP
jgi:hypothetical protein